MVCVEFHMPLYVHVGFLWVLGFPPTVKVYASRLIGYTKLPLGVNVCLCMCVCVSGPLQWIGIHGVFLSCTL